MTDLQMWSLLMGSLLPPVIAVVQQPRLPQYARALITFAICVVVGFMTAYLNHDLGGRPVTSAILLVLVTALTTYRNLWSKLGITQAIEDATSPGARVVRMDDLNPGDRRAE